MAAVPLCHIVCAGPGPLPALELGRDDLLIAADGGYAACLEAGLQPQLAIGDFDSLEGGVPQDAPCELRVLPRAKDDTDFMVCVREALTRGFRDIRAYQVLGGDLGHTMAAVKVLAWLREQGAQGMLQGCGQTALVIVPADGEAHLAQRVSGELPRGTRVSVFSLDGDAGGVCERGLAWELEDATLAASDHFGVSNEVASDDPVVSTTDGALLIIVG